METLDIVEITTFLKNLTERLRLETQEIFQNDLDLSREIQIGADGEPTTYIDKYSEDFLINAISKKFKCKIMSEELGIKNFGDNGKLFFIIDPIDGTSNAKRRLPFFSCSIAVLNDCDIVASIVKDLYNGDCFYAIKGAGAYYNNKKLAINYPDKPKKSVLLLSRPVSEKDFEFYKKITSEFGSNRIFGSPSLEICYVAAGKADAAIQIHEQPRATIMDIAAAKLILKESGGILLNETGKEIGIIEDPKYRTNFIACPDNPQIKEMILKLFI